MFADLKKLVPEPHGLLGTEADLDPVLCRHAAARGVAETQDDTTVLPFADTRLNDARAGAATAGLTDSLTAYVAHIRSDTKAAPLLMLHLI